MTNKKKSEKDPKTKMTEEIMEEKVKNDAPQNDISEAKSNGDSMENSMVEDLESEYEKVVSQSQEYFEGWQRERADFLNYKKRIERDQASLKNFITIEIIKKYLTVIDDMELAIKNRPSDDVVIDWMNGFNLIYQKLISILESEGVEHISTDGEFDPNIHEALTQIDSSTHESGQVVEVMRQGYKIGDRVIRPALVVVAR
jgi:molecular chaperone GrpE